MKHLYLSEDGEVKLFDRHRSEREFVELVYPKFRLMDLAQELDQTIEVRHRRWQRFDVAPPVLDTAIRRLVAERDEARELVREGQWRHPAVSSSWEHYEKSQAAIERWDHPLEEQAGHRVEEAEIDGTERGEADF